MFMSCVCGRGGYWLANFKMGWKDRELGPQMSASVGLASWAGQLPKEESSDFLPVRGYVWFSECWESSGGKRPVMKIRITKLESIPSVQHLIPIVSCANLKSPLYLLLEWRSTGACVCRAGEGPREGNVISSFCKRFIRPHSSFPFRGTPRLQLLCSVVWTLPCFSLASSLSPHPSLGSRILQFAKLVPKRQ